MFVNFFSLNKSLFTLTLLFARILHYILQYRDGNSSKINLQQIHVIAIQVYACKYCTGIKLGARIMSGLMLPIRKKGKKKKKI